MDYKDYYATLGIKREATQDEVKRAYRKLARKYHPDVSKEANAEARFKEVAEAHEALIDPERRAAYDAIGQRRERGPAFEPQQSADQDKAFSDFFESLFGRGRGGHDEGPRQRHEAAAMAAQGRDHHARIEVDLLDVYQGAQRSILLSVPHRDAQGAVTLQERRLDISIPKGLRSGQHLRLAGQGAADFDGGPPGDLYLEVTIRPHPPFRLDGADVYVDLPVAPWEAALGAKVNARTPQGEVQLTVPPDSPQGRKLRLKGKGVPGKVAGDLYVTLNIVLPSSATDAARQAYQALAQAFPGYDPRTTNIQEA